MNIRPLEHGADVVIHSATKYLNGHHDVLAGVVLGTASYIEEVRQKMILWGQAPDPFACWLLERGLKTLDVRVLRQNENALRIAKWCASRRRSRRCTIPASATIPITRWRASSSMASAACWRSSSRGAAPRPTISFAASRSSRHAPSLGGVDSLVSEPRFTSHAHMTSAERAAIGVPDGFLRISVGIENAEDLIADIAQALL